MFLCASSCLHNPPTSTPPRLPIKTQMTVMEENPLGCRWEAVRSLAQVDQSLLDVGGVLNTGQPINFDLAVTRLGGGAGGGDCFVRRLGPYQEMGVQGIECGIAPDLTWILQERPSLKSFKIKSKTLQNKRVEAHDLEIFGFSLWHFPIPAVGFGLPTARVYLRYLGGDPSVAWK